MGRRRGLEEAVPEAEKGFLNVCSNLGSLSPQQGQDHICIYMASPSPCPSPSWAHSIYVCVCVCVCVHTHAFSHVRLFCDPLDCRPPSLLCPWDFPGKLSHQGSLRPWKVQPKGFLRPWKVQPLTTGRPAREHYSAWPESAELRNLELVPWGLLGDAICHLT